MRSNTLRLSRNPTMIPIVRVDVEHVIGVFAFNQWFNVAKGSLCLSNIFYFHEGKEGVCKNFYRSFLFERSCSFTDNYGNWMSISLDKVEAFKSLPPQSQE